MVALLTLCSCAASVPPSEAWLRLMPGCERLVGATLRCVVSAQGHGEWWAKGVGHLVCLCATQLVLAVVVGALRKRNFHKCRSCYKNTQYHSLN